MCFLWNHTAKMIHWNSVEFIFKQLCYLRVKDSKQQVISKIFVKYYEEWEVKPIAIGFILKEESRRN